MKNTTMKIKCWKLENGKEVPMPSTATLDGFQWNGRFRITVSDDDGSLGLPFLFAANDTAILTVETSEQEGTHTGNKKIKQILSCVPRSLGEEVTCSRIRSHNGNEHVWSEWELASSSTGTTVEWDSASCIDSFVTAGVYNITGERLNASDGLPIENCAPGHTISARLTVLNSSITGTGESDDKCITQILSLSNRTGGDGDVYIRTGHAHSTNMLVGGAGWEPWSRLQQNVQVGQVTSLNSFIGNGIYSGVYTNGSSFFETFVMVVINNYAVAGKTGNVRSVSQFKYALNVDSTFSYKTRMGRGNTGISWGEWVDLGAATTTDIQDNSITAQKLSTALQEQINQNTANATKAANGAYWTSGPNAVTLNINKNDGTVGWQTLPAATTDKAGVMSAEDKKALDSVWEDVLRFANRTDNSFITKTGAISGTAKDISVFTLDGTFFKKIKAYIAADGPGASFIACYNSETISVDTLISNIVSINTTTWVNVDVPNGCKLIAVTSQNSILPEPQIYGITNAAKGVVDIREMVDVNTNTLKAFDPQQTLLCSNYLYTNAGTENAVSRIYYLTEQDNETIKGAFITGMLVNVLGTGTLSLYLADNIELSTRTDTLIEEIDVTELGVRVIRFSAPVVVGAGQTFGFKMGFKHAVSTTYGASGYMGVRYLNNDSLTLSNKDFGFGLVGMKKYESADKYPVTRGILGSFLNRTNPYYDHLFIDKINGENVIIPSESIYSVAISKRLGFDMLELNVKATSDAQFVVMHGDGGMFGKQFEHVDGITDISATAINSVTLAWIKENVRYKSIYAKYRTAPSTLEDMLYECKRNGIVPFVQRTDVKVNNAWITSIAVADRIMGVGNYVSYGGGARRETSASIYYYGSESSLEAILAVCNKFGAPFIYGMNGVTKFSDEELKTIVDTLHNKGYFIAFAGSYQKEPLNQKLLAMGFDMSASGWNVPVFTDSNITCVDELDRFTHNGTVTDGVLALNAGNALSIEHTGDIPFLSVGLLQLRFKGTLKVTMGDYIDDEFTSDGNSAIILTTYYMEKAPVFNITSVADTVITEILFKASKR